MSSYQLVDEAGAELGGGRPGGGGCGPREAAAELGEAPALERACHCHGPRGGVPGALAVVSMSMAL